MWFKYKSLQIIIFGFLILKESIANPWHVEKSCLPSSPTSFEQFPHIVFIKSVLMRKILCQGTLINTNWVLTSAGCLSDDVGVLTNDIYLAIGNGTREIIRKPKRTEVRKTDDVTLIEINEPIIVISTVKPIELATEDFSTDMKCVISGYQKHSNNDNSVLVYWNVVNVSKHTTDLYLRDTICNEKSSQNITYDSTPLICNNHLYGLSSIINPRIFNNIFNYKKWIQNVINPTTSIKISNNFNNAYIHTNIVVMENIEGFEYNNSTSSGKKKSMTAKSQLETKSIPSRDPNSTNTEDTTTYPEIIESEALNSADPTDNTGESITESDDLSSPVFEPISTATDYGNDTETTKNDQVSKQSSFNTQTTQSTITNKWSPDPTEADTKITHETEETYETEESQSSTQTSINTPTTQTLATEEWTPSPKPSILSTHETKETEDSQFSTQTSTNTPTIQSSITEEWTPSPKPSTSATEETGETFETEDSQSSTQTSINTPTTQSSTTEEWTPSPKTSIHTEYESEGTYETEDLTTIHVDTPPTTTTSTTTTSPSTKTVTTTSVTDISTSASTTVITSAATTVATSVTTTTTTTSTPTNISTSATITNATTAATYNTTVVTDVPKSTTEITETKESTTTVPEQSSSQIILYNINLITLLCCVIYFINL